MGKINTPMMSCGHAANSTSEGKPSCAICYGIRSLVVVPTPDLANRIARCGYGCGNERPSDPDRLAFFEYRPEQEKDSYYCGCRGWD